MANGAREVNSPAMGVWRRVRLKPVLLSLGAVCTLTMMLTHRGPHFGHPTAHSSMEPTSQYIADVHLNRSQYSTSPGTKTSHGIPRYRNDLENLVKVIQTQRKKQIERTCKSWPQNQNLTAQMLNHLLVDEDHKMLYCVIPKVGCTNWKRVFVMMSGKYNISGNMTRTLKVHDYRYMRHLGFRYLGEYSADERMQKINSYYKFLFVRNPFERLLSAFRDKFNQYNKYTKYFHYKYGRIIISRYRDNPNKTSLSKGSDVTFGEFVKYVTDIPKRREQFNPHWIPYYEICNPCKISFDYIGKMETLQADAAFIMNKFQNNTHDIGSAKPFPPPSHKRPRTGSVIQNFYRDIPAESIEELTEVYKRDFLLFDYNPSDILSSRT